MSFQQCRFNFGSEPFQYPPQNRSFDSFNGHATLKPQDKIVLPRHLFLEQLRKLSVREDSCTLCFDMKGIIRLEPCKHRCEMDFSPPFFVFLIIFTSSQGILQKLCIAATVLSNVSRGNCSHGPRRIRQPFANRGIHYMILIFFGPIS